MRVVVDRAMSVTMIQCISMMSAVIRASCVMTVGVSTLTTGSKDTEGEVGSGPPLTSLTVLQYEQVDHNRLSQYNTHAIIPNTIT
jgi:hypothetical protein